MITKIEEVQNWGYDEVQVSKEELLLKVNELVDAFNSLEHLKDYKEFTFIQPKKDNPLYVLKVPALTPGKPAEKKEGPFTFYNFREQTVNGGASVMVPEPVVERIIADYKKRVIEKLRANKNESFNMFVISAYEAAINIIEKKE